MENKTTFHLYFFLISAFLFFSNPLFSQEIDEEDKEVIEEIIIDASINKVNIKKPEMSVNKLTTEEIKKIPVVLGETDVIKTLTLLPGVTNSGEGTTGFNVRGGGSDQNLILLDQTQIFGTSHLYGFFSIFNSDAINSLKLYKGSMPARYGGRASSTLEVSHKTGNYQKFKTNGGIGLLSSRLTVETPIIRDKMSLLVSGRGSYAHLFLKLTDLKSNAYFYDINMKWSYIIDAKSNIQLLAYLGQDVFKFNNFFENTFGNKVVSLNHNYIYNNKLTSNTYLNYTDYSYNLIQPFVGFDYHSGIKNYDFKYLLNHTLTDKINLKYGIQSQYYQFVPGRILPLNETSNFVGFTIPNKYALETALFVDSEHELTDKINIQYGFRQSFFNRYGKENIRLYENNQPVVYNYQLKAYEKATPIGETYYSSGQKIASFQNFEPRIALSLQTKEEQSIKISYNKTTQYIHLISNTTAATPLDIWEPSGPYVRPLIMQQYTIGFFQNFKNNMYSLEIESYFKNGKNRLDYIDGAELIANRAIEQVLLSGKTKSYGLELLLRKNTGKFTGWIAYTLSKSLQQTKGRTENEIGINNNEWYRTPNDRLHDLSIVTSYQWNNKWVFSVNLTLQSGRPVTYPVGKYEFLGNTINDYNYRNNYSLPTFHHVDISAIYSPNNTNKKWKGEWIFSVYNIYNRKNAASISFRENNDFVGKTEAVKLSIFGIVPSVTYNFKF